MYNGVMQGGRSQTPYHEFYADDFTPREHYRLLWDHIKATGNNALEAKAHESQLALQAEGVTFTVYGESEEGIERIWPFDLIPRIITAPEWVKIESGLKQRVRALNLFLGDLYGDQKIIKDGVIPPELIYQGRDFRREIVSIVPPRGIYTHISGIDIIRDER